jgi:hypothetical protein
MIFEKRINIIHCIEGVYLRWWFNGWHYWLFNNGYDLNQTTEHLDTMVINTFSKISRKERPTRIKTIYDYNITLENITPENIKGFSGLLAAEKVEQYEDSVWREVEIKRKTHIVKEENSPGYSFSFDITRKEIPSTASIYHRFQYLYVKDILADLDDDEVISINKQENDIADMQDRQSDFTAEFKIRRTRTMRSLFEVTGESGATTDIPYTKIPCRYVIDGIELIGNGYLIITKKDDNYYYVAAYFGNLNFFEKIEDLTINDLLLPDCNHTWAIMSQSSSHNSLGDFLYPLLEPSDDGGIIPLTDNGLSCSLYGGWVWPFVKIKTIFDEIITNAGYTAYGDVLTEDKFNRLYMSISNKGITALSDWYYSATDRSNRTGTSTSIRMIWSNIIVGGIPFQSGYYSARAVGKYTFEIKIWVNIRENYTCEAIKIQGVVSAPITFSSYTYVADSFGSQIRTFVCEYDITANGDPVGFWAQMVKTSTDMINQWRSIWMSIKVIAIEDTKASYNFTFDSTVDLSIANNLPDISQTEFLKMVCNLFALIPHIDPRQKKITFWNYSKLYENIPYARNWSAYMSEKDTECEFRIGDYCQNNYMNFNDSDDVVDDAGRGDLQVIDETLELKQDSIDCPLATTDSVIILTNEIVSRINMNIYQSDDSTYEEQDEIDARIVIAEQTTDQSPAKQLTFRSMISGGSTMTVDTPYKVRGLTFGDVIENYGSLAKMLNKANLRKAKFNLPAYEVAGFKHYIPIYLSQFKAYFYVNKITNYVPGKLCTVELIKL